MRLLKITELECPSCGAPIRPDESGEIAVCPFCGNTCAISDTDTASRQNAEDLGYYYEKGRQRARAEMQQTPAYTAPTLPKRRHTWLWVLGWIFLFPVPATILLVRSKTLPPVLKGVLIAAVWLLFIWLGNNKDPKPAAPATPPAVEETQEAL